MESEQLLVEADRWLAEVEKKFPKRNFTATVVNLEGVSIFVTRYIKALNPPEEALAGGDVCFLQHATIAALLCVIQAILNYLCFIVI